MPKNVYCVLNYPMVNKTWGRYTAPNEDKAAAMILTDLGKELNVSNESDNAYVVFTIKNMRTGRTYIYLGTRVKLVVPYEGQRYRNIWTKLDKRKSLKANLRETINLE